MANVTDAAVRRQSFRKRRVTIAGQLAKLEEEAYSDGVLATITMLEGLILSASDESFIGDLVKFIRSNREKFGDADV